MSELEMRLRELVAEWRDRANETIHSAGPFGCCADQLEDAIAAMSQRPGDAVVRTCQCSLRTKLVGDGCDVCNPELAADLAAEEEDEE